MQKCVLIMDFTETVLIDLIMLCFMECVLSSHWIVSISNGTKMLWLISIKNSLQLENSLVKWAGVWQG